MNHILIVMQVGAVAFSVHVGYQHMQEGNVLFASVMFFLAFFNIKMMVTLWLSYRRLVESRKRLREAEERYRQYVANRQKRGD